MAPACNSTSNMLVPTKCDVFWPSTVAYSCSEIPVQQVVNTHLTLWLCRGVEWSCLVVSVAAGVKTCCCMAGFAACSGWLAGAPVGRHWVVLRCGPGQHWHQPTGGSTPTPPKQLLSPSTKHTLSAFWTMSQPYVSVFMTIQCSRFGGIKLVKFAVSECHPWGALSLAGSRLVPGWYAVSICISVLCGGIVLSVHNTHHTSKSSQASCAMVTSHLLHRSTIAHPWAICRSGLCVALSAEQDRLLNRATVPANPEALHFCVLQLSDCGGCQSKPVMNYAVLGL